MEDQLASFLSLVKSVESLSVMSEDKINVWKGWMMLIKNGYSDMSPSFIDETMNALLNETLNLILLGNDKDRQLSWNHIEMVVFFTQRICSILAYFTPTMQPQFAKVSIRTLLTSHGLLVHFMILSGHDCQTLIQRSAENIKKALTPRQISQQSVSSRSGSGCDQLLMGCFQSNILASDKYSALSSLRCQMLAHLGIYHLTSGRSTFGSQIDLPCSKFVCVDLWFRSASVLSTLFCGIVEDAHFQQALSTFASFIFTASDPSVPNSSRDGINKTSANDETFSIMKCLVGNSLGDQADWQRGPTHEFHHLSSSCSGNNASASGTNCGDDGDVSCEDELWQSTVCRRSREQLARLLLCAAISQMSHDATQQSQHSDASDSPQPTVVNYVWRRFLDRVRSDSQSVVTAAVTTIRNLLLVVSDETAFLLLTEIIESTSTSDQHSSNLQPLSGDAPESLLSRLPVQALLDRPDRRITQILSNFLSDSIASLATNKSNSSISSIVNRGCALSFLSAIAQCDGASCSLRDTLISDISAATVIVKWVSALSDWLGNKTQLKASQSTTATAIVWREEELRHVSAVLSTLHCLLLSLNAHKIPKGVAVILLTVATHGSRAASVLHGGIVASNRAQQQSGTVQVRNTADVLLLCVYVTTAALKMVGKSALVLSEKYEVLREVLLSLEQVATSLPSLQLPMSRISEDENRTISAHLTLVSSQLWTALTSTVLQMLERMTPESRSGFVSNCLSPNFVHVLRTRRGVSDAATEETEAGFQIVSDEVIQWILAVDTQLNVGDESCTVSGKRKYSL